MKLLRSLTTLNSNDDPEGDKVVLSFAAIIDQMLPA